MNRILFYLTLFLAFVGCKKKHDPDEREPLPRLKANISFIKVDGTKTFTRVCFPTETTGYIANSQGDIYKTTNVGSTWSALTVPSRSPIYDLWFFNVNEGFAVGGESDCGGTGCVPLGASMLCTKDGGVNWNTVSLTLSQPVQLRSLVFLDDSIGFAVGGPLVLHTKDRGKTWKETKLENLGGSMQDIAFNKQNGLIVTALGNVLRTTNGGLNWNVLSPLASSATFSIVWKSSQAFVGGLDGISLTNDRGASWREVSNSPFHLFKLVFTSNTIGYAFGRRNTALGEKEQGSFYATEDGGTTWAGGAEVKEMEIIEDASFPSAHIGFAVGGSFVMRIEVP